MHYQRTNEYRRRNDAQITDLLLCIFCAVGISKITDESRQKIMDTARSEKDRLFNLLSLVGKNPETEKEKKQREEKHLAGQQEYAEALSSLGKFGSIDQLNAAITALNETIQESVAKDGEAEESESKESDTGKDAS